MITQTTLIEELDVEFALADSSWSEGLLLDSDSVGGEDEEDEEDTDDMGGEDDEDPETMGDEN